MVPIIWKILEYSTFFSKTSIIIDIGVVRLIANVAKREDVKKHPLKYVTFFVVSRESVSWQVYFYNI